MKTTTHFRQVLVLLLTLAAMAVGQSEALASNWTVYGSESSTTLYILVNRDHRNYDETIYYRTVSLSAIDGQHFTAVSGSRTIHAGDDGTSFEVPLLNPTVEAFKYQSGTKRRFRVEILDRAGFVLATYNYDKTSGTDVDTFTHLFDVQDVTVNSGTITVTDKNYSQAYHAVSIANYFSATAPQAYFLNIGAQLRMTLGFQAKENDDGYQHVQILVNQTSNHDEGAGDNNPGTMNYSSYMATFCHKGGSKNTTDSNYLFPVTSKGNNCGNVGLVWGDINTTNNVGELRQQYFNTNCRASDGRLIIPTDLNTLGIRFDASGDNEDTWYADNTVAHIQANDATSPQQQGNIVLSPGRHAKGNVAYLSILFSEAVNVVGASDLKLSTTWGDFKYEAGAGSNVLTFRGTITANAGRELTISSMNDQSGSSASVYITDLAGNKIYLNTTVSTTFSGVTVDADLATYTLDDFEQDSDGNYLISTIADLRGLASYVNAGNDATGLTFRQTNNIAGIGTLAPIGVSEDKAFNGTYDGGGFSLSGITINGNSASDNNNVGLFGTTGANAVVKNVWLKSSTIKGKWYVGGIVGKNYGVIRNCLVESSVTVAYYDTTYASDAHGGIAGYGWDNFSIEGCRSAAKLTVSSSKGGQYYGGIVGNLSKVRTTVKDCLYTGGTFGTNYAGNSYGTITGLQPAPTSQILFNNYYTTDNYQAVGWSTTDVDGARKARTLTLGEGLSIDGDVTTYDVSGITAYGNVAIGYDNKIYSGATQTLTLNYSGEVPAGNDLVLTVTDADNNDITATALDGHVLTMPDADVTVTASVVPHEPGEPGYTWFLLEGQWQCQGKRFCTRCGILADLDDATVTSAVTREATCGEWGETTWTATFTKPGYETQTHTQENIEPTYQHTWGEPTYNWREEDDWNHIAYCTASRECSVCHETESEEGSVTWLYEHNRNDRTCTEGSGNGYEATFTNDVFTTQTWCTDLGPLGHDWNIPDANWDYMPCSRHITCKRCNFERTVYATMTYDVITEPTCTTAGEYLYHATFDFPTDNLPYPDANVESRYYQIPALGHEYDTDPVWAWAADYASATLTFTCSRCHETQDYDATVTQEGNTYTATVTVNGTAYTDKQYPPVLYVGSNTVHLPGHYASVYYTFTAPADGWYHIWSEGCTEYLNAWKSIGEGSWTTQDIDHIDNDFTTLIEMRAETTITFEFYTMNAVDVPVFVQPVTTHTLTVVQPADGEIWVADYNSGTDITDTGDVREGVRVELWTNVSSAMNTVTWTVTDADGQPVKVYNTSSNFFIMPGKDVTVTAIIEPLFLDDTATDNDDILNNVLGQNGNVCIGRTLYKDGSWNTLCLPFDVTLEGSPLEGAVAKTLDKKNTTMTGTHVHLVFSEPVTTLWAGTPYIIKWDSGDDIVNPVFKDVFIDTSSAVNLSSSDGCTRFTGTFNARNITPNNTNLYYMTADNTLKHTTTNRTLKGFRAYFFFFPNDSDVKALTFDIDFGDGEATGIEEMHNDECIMQNNAPVYDLSGRRVSTPTKGMYIVNGKKVFVK